MSRLQTLILEILALAQGQCLPATEIIERLRVREYLKEAVWGSLNSLIKKGIVWEKEEGSRGNPEFCLGGTVPPTTAARHAVLQVATTEEVHTAGELARFAGVESSAASQACRTLESHGWLERGDPAKKRKLLFPLTGETVNPHNYERIDSIRRELGEIVDAHEPGDPILARALERFLRELVENADLEKIAVKIRSGSEEILQAARTAKTRSEIKRAFSFKAYFEDVATWRLITGR